MLTGPQRFKELKTNCLKCVGGILNGFAGFLLADNLLPESLQSRVALLRVSLIISIQKVLQYPLGTTNPLGTIKRISISI